MTDPGGDVMPATGGGLRVGGPVPEFRLPGIDGRTGDPLVLGTADLRGRPTVIAFYPADDTPVCTRQLLDYTREIGRFADLDAAVVAISPQSPASHASFAAAQGGFGFPLLSDEDLVVGRAYGVVGLLDLYRRSTFVVDGDGILRYAHRPLGAAMDTPYRTPDTLLEVLRGMGVTG